MAMNVVDEVSLGQRLQTSRQQAGLTQQELCHKAGLSYSTLAKIERGAIKAPSIFTIKSIAEVVGTSLDELVGGTHSTPLANGVSKNGVRFVYFDINGCLVRFFHRAFTKLAGDSGASPDTIETTFWHYNDAVCRGDMSMDDFNRAFAQQVGLKKMDWQEYYLDAVDPIKEMDELLGWVAKHYKVGLLSNIMPGLIDTMRANGLLPNVKYQAIVDSSVARAIKPEPQIYEYAEKKAGCRSAEILLVDDSRSNLMTAEHQGWHVLWFDDYRPAESAARVREALDLATGE